MEKQAAVVLCEGFFDRPLGKGAHGLVRHSLRFDVLGIVDSRFVGKDAGEVLDGNAKGIPFFTSLKHALETLDRAPEAFIVGVTPPGGRLPDGFRAQIEMALERGMTVYCGMHEFLGDDPALGAMAKKYGGDIIDIRRTPPLFDLHMFQNRVKDLPVLRIASLGTDSSVGKRTTALELVFALNDAGVKTTFVATGQSGLLQGSRFGLPLDATRGDYMVGELEHQILRAWEEERPRIIVVEGQGALSHPAYVCGSRAVVMAARPQGVILTHAPGRKARIYRQAELKLPMPEIQTELELVRVMGGCPVIGIALNPEGMDPDQVDATAKRYSREFGVPADNVLKNGCDGFVNTITHLLEDAGI